MKLRNLIAIGIIGYVCGVIAIAPATLVDAALQRLSNNTLRLVEAQGTLWTGSGQLEIRDLGGRIGVSKSLSWRVLPKSLLAGHMVCEIELGQDAKPFQIELSPFRIDFADADIKLPAAALGIGVPKLAPLGLTGELSMHVASMAISREEWRGNVTLQWHDAGSVLSTVSPLGDYELDAVSEGSKVRLLLRTLQGALQLDGSGSWVNGERPDFIAVARVLPQHQPQLAPLLRLIGMEREPGRFELKL